MNESYLQKLTDDRVRQALFQKENLARVEAIVDNDLRRWRELATLREATVLSGRVDEAKAADLFPKVREEVDHILGLRGLQPPALRVMRLFSGEHGDILATYGLGMTCLGVSAASLGWRLRRDRGASDIRIDSQPVPRRRALLGLALMVPGGLLMGKGAFTQKFRMFDAGYVSEQERVEIPYGRTCVQAELLLAHEYVHHTQQVTGFYHQKDLALLAAIEGHARGVERLWARERNRQLQRREYECYQLRLRLPELQRTYLAMCGHLSASPKNTLLGGRPPMRGERADPNPREFGYVLFRIYESTMGPGIYGDLIRGTFPAAGLLL